MAIRRLRRSAVLGASLVLAVLAPAALADILPTTVTGDIHGDGVPDRVEVKPNAGDPDLFDVLVELTAARRTVLALELGAGELIDGPAIDKGELVLSFGWYPGRYKSTTTFTIGLQDGKLVVRHYNTAVADSLGREKDGSVPVKVCDADFVANRVTIDDKPATPPPGPPIALAAWRDNSVPKACQSLF